MALLDSMGRMPFHASGKMQSPSGVHISERNSIWRCIRQRFNRVSSEVVQCCMARNVSMIAWSFSRSGRGTRAMARWKLALTEHRKVRSEPCQPPSK
jgi:hypothetical protein